MDKIIKNIDNLINEESIEINKIIKLYQIELNYYQEELKDLLNNKPLFFMKKANTKYQNRFNELKNNIKICEERLNKYLK